MIKVKTIGMIEKNAKNNPVVKAHQDLKNGALHVAADEVTAFPTDGTAEAKQDKNICIALNIASGDDRYTDFTIKKGEFVKIVNNDAIINEFADRFMLWQEGQKDNYTLKSLEKSLKQTENAIKNTMHAIDSGIITQSVKSHLVELESNKIELEKSIAKEKLESPKLERDSIVWFLSRFKKCDISDTYWRIFLVDTFLQAAYLYDNGKLLLSLNFSGKNNKINVKILEEATANGEILCSNFKHTGAPKNQKMSRTAGEGRI